jgi:hypothetical protein
MMPMTTYDYKRLYQNPGEIAYKENKEPLKLVDRFVAPEVLNYTNATEMKTTRFARNYTEKVAFNASVDVFSFGFQLIRTTRMGFFVMPYDYFGQDIFTKEAFDEMLNSMEEDARSVFGYEEDASVETQCENSRSAKMFKRYVLFWLAKKMIVWEPEKRIGMIKVMRELHYLKITDEETLFDDIDDNDWDFEKRQYPKKPSFFVWLGNKIKRMARKSGLLKMFKDMGAGLKDMAKGLKGMIPKVSDLKGMLKPPELKPPELPDDRRRRLKEVFSDAVLQKILEEGYTKYNLWDKIGKEYVPEVDEDGFHELPNPDSLLKYFANEFRTDHPSGHS